MKVIRSRIDALRPTLMSKGAVALRFLTAQSISTVLYLLFGIACVRFMATEEYAKFVVVNGIMGTVLILMDSNLTGTLVPLIGERALDKRLIADYVASLRLLSTRLYIVGALGFTAVFPYLVHNRGWSRATIAGMILAILATTWFARLASNYLPVLMITGDRDMWYKFNLFSSSGTLVLLLLCSAFRWLGAFQAIAINVIGYMFAGWLCYSRSQKLLGVRGVPSTEKRNSIIRLALPNVPSSIFFAVQGQLALYLMTYFGRTKSIASIGALSRLGQLFAVFLMANSVLVEPYFAKLPKEKLKKNFAFAVLLACTIAVCVWSLAVLFPDILLWVLGPQYGGMRHELRLAVGASAISFVSATFWGVNTARRFVYWWNVGANIALTFTVQALFIWKADLALLETALWMNIAVNCASLLLNAMAAGWGFLRGPRETEHTIPITQAEQETLSILEGSEIAGYVVPASTPLKIADTMTTTE